MTLRDLPAVIYRCSRCGVRWRRGRPAHLGAVCSCGSVRVVWVNYEEWAEQAGLYPYTGTVASILRDP